jgi:hypothetical protein
MDTLTTEYKNVEQTYPPWIHAWENSAALFMSLFPLQSDMQLSRMLDSLVSRAPDPMIKDVNGISENVPADALRWMAHNYGLSKTYREINSSIINRASNAFSHWSTAGTTLGMYDIISSIKALDTTGSITEAFKLDASTPAVTGRQKMIGLVENADDISFNFDVYIDLRDRSGYNTYDSTVIHTYDTLGDVWSLVGAEQERASFEQLIREIKPAFCRHRYTWYRYIDGLEWYGYTPYYVASPKFLIRQGTNIVYQERTNIRVNDR